MILITKDYPVKHLIICMKMFCPVWRQQVEEVYSVCCQNGDKSLQHHTTFR